MEMQRTQTPLRNSSGGESDSIVVVSFGGVFAVIQFRDSERHRLIRRELRSLRQIRSVSCAREPDDGIQYFWVGHIRMRKILPIGFLYPLGGGLVLGLVRHQD